MIYKIDPIKQDDADRCLKKVYSSDKALFKNVEKAFQEERERRNRGERLWALPPSERSYYIVSINENDTLLAGIDVKALNISSFAKVTSDREFKCMGYFCVKKLIEDVLVDQVKNNKTIKTISANTWESPAGTRIFECLAHDLPKGIGSIEQTQVGFALHLA